MDLIKWLNKHLLVYWIPLGIVAFIIFFFSVLKSPFSAIGIPEGDLLDFNTLHIPAYFALSFLAGIAFRHTTNLKFHHYTLAIIFAFAFGTLMEITQGFVPGRTASLIDSTHSLIGAALAQPLRFVLKQEKRLLNKII